MIYAQAADSSLWYVSADCATTSVVIQEPSVFGVVYLYALLSNESKPIDALRRAVLFWILFTPPCLGTISTLFALRVQTVWHGSVLVKRI